jgi:hypothetical protein
MLKGKAAIGAVDATLRAIDEWRATRVQCGQPAPDVGAGIASGPVLFGIVGDGSGSSTRSSAMPSIWPRSRRNTTSWSAHGPLRHMPPMRRP